MKNSLKKACQPDAGMHVDNITLGILSENKSARRKMRRAIAIAAALVLAGTAAFAGPEPTPTHANVSYGPHPNQMLDIYLPPAAKEPAPVVLWFGTLGKPSKHPGGIGALFPANCAVVAVQMRTLADAEKDKVDPPISYCLLDARRAVQFVRLNADKWHLDPRRIGVGGSSQAALPALFVACGGEKADPKAADPVERVSTKVVCAGCGIPGAALSIDPQRAQEWVPQVQWGFKIYGCTFAEALKRREELLPKIKQWSPDWFLNKDCPPIYLQFSTGLTKPDNVERDPYYIHAPMWGLGFQKLAQEHGATCYVSFPGHPSEKYTELWDFMVKQLTAAPK